MTGALGSSSAAATSSASARAETGKSLDRQTVSCTFRKLSLVAKLLLMDHLQVLGLKM